MKMLLVCLLLVCLAGCSWSLFGERDIADMPGVNAPNPDTDNPVTAKFLPTLTDEVIVATWGAMALKVGIELARDMADTPWVLLIAVLGIMVSLAAWKIGRKRGWWGRSSSGQPSGASASPSSSPVSRRLC